MSDDLLLAIIAIGGWALLLGGLALLADYLSSQETALRNRYRMRH